MSFLTFRPYSSEISESGAIAIFSFFLKHHGFDVDDLQCDGTLSVCTRDKFKSWKRSLDSCIFCAAENDVWSSWVGSGSKKLSTFMSVSINKETKNWVDTLEFNSESDVIFREKDFSKIVSETFKMRYSQNFPNINNQAQMLFYKRLLLSAARVYLAGLELIEKENPKMFFLGDNKDFVSNAMSLACRDKGTNYINFEAREDLGQLIVSYSEKKDVLTCDFSFDNLLTQSREISSWSPKFIDSIRKISAFLDINPEQISLPL